MVNTQYAYYPGCTIKSTAKNFEQPALASLKKVGIELVEVPRWNCCGTVHALAKDDVMHQIASTRVLVRVEDMNREGSLSDNFKLVTLCAMCYNTLKRVNQAVTANRDKMTKLHDIMDRDQPYQGKVEVLHLLELLRETGFHRVSESVTKPLTGLRIAPYYGCLLLRPKGFGIDDADNPTVMENLVEALKGEVVKLSYRTRCCGAYHSVARKDIVSETAHKILKQAQDMKADLLTVACPLCSYNLSEMQDEVEKRFSDFRRIPVLYFTQLMGLALGLSEEECRLAENHVDPRPMLKSRNLI